MREELLDALRDLAAKEEECDRLRAVLQAVYDSGFEMPENDDGSRYGISARAWRAVCEALGVDGPQVEGGKDGSFVLRSSRMDTV